MDGRVVEVVVDAEDDRDVLVLCWRGDDDLLGAGVDVACASVASVKRPVDSMTTSTPRSPHGSAAGSRSARAADLHGRRPRGLVPDDLDRRLGSAAGSSRS